jgi:general stress protein 26
MDWSEVVETCRAIAPGAFLATVGDDGRPHVAWVGLAFGADDLTMATHRRTRKARNLAANSRVALHWPLGNHPQVFMRANARLVTDPDEISARWEAGGFPYDLAAFFGGPHNPELVFAVLAPTHASVQRALGQPPEVWRAGT